MNSNSKTKTAIIVPFRDMHKEQQRSKHLATFVPYMTNYMTKHTSSKPNHEFKIYIVCQTDDDHQFNRGKLLNIGFKYAVEDNCNVIIPHDVDLLPSDELAPYYTTIPDNPVHIAKVWDRYTDNKKYFGGVVALSTETYKIINGFPNNFWGWGGEDDEFYRRLTNLKITQAQPPKYGSYTDLENMNLDTKLQVLREHKEWKCMIKKELLKVAPKNWENNGLNSIVYKEWAVLQINPFCDFITVDIVKHRPKFLSRVEDNEDIQKQLQPLQQLQQTSKQNPKEEPKKKQKQKPKEKRIG